MWHDSDVEQGLSTGLVGRRRADQELDVAVGVARNEVEFPSGSVDEAARRGEQQVGASLEAGDLALAWSAPGDVERCGRSLVRLDPKLWRQVDVDR